MAKWTKEEWAAYQAWMTAWLQAHEHELPPLVRSKNGRWVRLGKKHKWQLANAAWLEMRRAEHARPMDNGDRPEHARICPLSLL